MKNLRALDLWIYELPFDTITRQDRVKAKEYNVICIRDVLNDADYLVGTWNSILEYTMEYMGYEINNDYLKPLQVKEKE